MSDKIRNLKKAITKLSVELGREPTNFELSQYMNLNEKQIINIKKSCSQEPISLETPVADDLMLLDYIADEDINLPDIKVSNDLLSEDVVNILLKNLSLREKRILIMRFGLMGQTPMTLEEVGKQLGFSKERIRQLECEILKKFRNSKNVTSLKEYLS